MSVRVTCPCCGSDYPVEAGLVEGDAKRLAGVVATMEPALARPALNYLALFRPAKSSLRLARAAKLLADLAALVDAGTVCKDERSGMRRPALAAHWIAGIEQMLATRDRLELPLANHNYLRAIVYGLADQADAAAERQREEDLRVGRRPGGTSSGISPPQPREDRLRNQLAWLAQQLSYGQITDDEHEQLADEARAKYGAQRHE